MLEIPEIDQLCLDSRKFLQFRGKDPKRDYQLIATLRHLHSNGLLGTDVPSRRSIEQLRLMCRLLRTEIATAGIAELAMSEQEFEDTYLLPCIEQHREIYGTICPYFRAPLPEPRLIAWKESLGQAIRRMQESSASSLLNSRHIRNASRPAVERHFWKQLVKQLIVAPIVAAENSHLKTVYESIYTEPLTQVDSNPAGIVRDQGQHDQLEFDFLRSSNERLMAVLLSLVPAWLPDRHDEHWTTYRANITLTSAFPPYSQVDANLTSCSSREWIVVLFSDFVSNDGNLLCERRLLRHCFAFNRRSHNLYRYSPDNHSLVDVRPDNDSGAHGAVYFYDSYAYGDVENVLAAISSLFQESHLHQSTNGEAFIVPLGGSPVVLKLISNDDNGDSPTESGTGVSRVSVPPMMSVYRLRSSNDADALEVPQVLFRNGCTLTSDSHPDSDSTTNVVVTAQSRVHVISTLVKQPQIRFLSAHGEILPVSVCRQLMDACPCVRCHAVLQDSMKDQSRSALESDLLAVTHVLSRHSTASRSLEWRLRDARIGLLISLYDRPAALTELSKQASSMQMLTDKAAVAGYFSHYAALLREDNFDRLSTSYLLTQARRRLSFPIEPVPATTEPSETRHIRNLAPTASATEDVMNELRKATATESGRADELRRFAISELEASFSYQPDWQTTDAATRKEIVQFWQNSWAEIDADDDSYRQALMVNTLIWRIFSRCRAFHEPLSVTDKLRKAEQIEVLSAIIAEVPNSIETAVGHSLHSKTRTALQSEAERSVSRLSEYSGSPFYPELYWPIPDSAFQQAIMDIRKRIGANLAKFKDAAEKKRAELIKDTMSRVGSDDALDFFGERFQSWVELAGRPEIGLATGAVVRHYGLTCRFKDLNDKKLFPFMKVRGITLVYRMHAGLTTKLRIEWPFSGRN